MYRYTFIYRYMSVLLSGLLLMMMLTVVFVVEVNQ